MSKRYKGKTCVYCTTPGSSQGGDHVVAREFFPIDRRGGLPQVPACKGCNEAKSNLEHYATTVMPFGGRYPGAGSVLADMVPPRLARNAPLQRELTSGMRSRFVSRDGMSWARELTLPLDGQRIASLFDYIARGLAFKHWSLLFPEDQYFVHSEFFVGRGRELFDSVFNMNGNRTGACVLGAGEFTYEGVQSFESPQLNLWRMSFGGVVMGDDVDAPGEIVVQACAVTAPNRLASALTLVDRLRSMRGKRMGEAVLRVKLRAAAV